MTDELQLPARPERCVRCNAPLAAPIGCLQCHTVFPGASQLNHFERLGLRLSFSVSVEELNRLHLAWSRELHPDFYQSRPTAEQLVSLRLSAALNDAVSTLRDPIRRAEYLLLLWGGPTAADHREMPDGFFETILELRMEVEEAAESLDSEECRALAERLESDRADAMDRLGALFASVEAKIEGGTPEELIQIRQQLNTVRYLDGLMRQLRDR